MATVTKEICEEIITGNGWYRGDPVRVVKVVTYNNMFDGGLTWAIVYPDEDLMRYENSPACQNVKVIWEAK